MNEDTRIINLYDDDTDLLVYTNAPEEAISKAIEYKNEMLVNSFDSFRSDFEEIQEYLQKLGYIFEQIGYIDELEGYYW